MDVHAPVGPDQKAYVKYLATMFSVIAKKVMVKWSMTQVLSSDQCQVPDDIKNDIFWADFESVCVLQHMKWVGFYSQLSCIM